MKIARRSILKSLGALSATTAIQTYARASAPHVTKPTDGVQRPNILVFLTDDHGQWLQQTYGNSEVYTPNMTRIASNGVRMTNAFTTCPVCSPARASFFTGRMPSQHGIHDYLDETNEVYSSYPWLQGQTLLSEHLRKQGYRTGLVGKWHCGSEREPHPGFDFWYSHWLTQYPHEGMQQLSDNGMRVEREGFQSPMFTEQAVRFLNDHYQDQTNGKQPWFLYVSYSDTHSPHTQMPSELVSQYDGASFRDLPVEAFERVHGTVMAPVDKDPALERVRKQQYYAAASSVDREVGKILDYLEKRGLLEQTLVVYTGDHGLNAGQHGIWEKGNATVPQNFLEESIRVPCAVAWPNGGVPRNLETDIFVNHCDLFATLLEAAQARSDGQTQAIPLSGRSYLAHLRGHASSDWKDAVICEYGNARMIRKADYKLILRYPFRGVTFPNEFYDLRADARETKNLYTDARFGTLIAELRAELDRFFAQYSIPGHDGLDMEHQPIATDLSPWIEALSPQPEAAPPTVDQHGHS
jgi:choline-sulfatase